MIAAMPACRGEQNDALTNEFETVKEIVANLRTLRLQKNIPNKEPLFLQVIGEYNPVYNSVITKMANLSGIEGATEKAPGAVSFLVKTTEFAVPMADSINVAEELEKLQTELIYQQGFLQSVLDKLSNESFVAKAPAKVIEMERKKQADAESKIKSLEESMEALKLL
jgi:valyl-tRNA synthetase